MWLKIKKVKVCNHDYKYQYFNALTGEEYYKCSLCGKILAVKVKLFDEFWCDENVDERETY